MTQNKKIAVTGGIGSGKSTVIDIIKSKGYTVFSSDLIYADLLKNENFLNKLCSQFGDVLNEYGELDRKKLSSIVFNSTEELVKLNAITHPAIYEEMFKRAEDAGGVCFCEVPLLFESGGESLFDGVIVILRDEGLRLKCVALRDNLTDDDVKKRMNSQFKYENIDYTKYYVIYNNGSLSHLERQIDEILIKLDVS